MLGVLVLGAVYLVGKEKGQSLRFGSMEVDVKGKNPVPGLKAPSLPTYQPTGESFVCCVHCFTWDTR